MSKKTVDFNWSDAWLLLAVVYAGNEGANLERIIEIGDGIEHAIFNPDELESGLARLTSGGYIDEKSGVFYATHEALRSYLKSTSPRRRIYKDLENIQKLIGAASSSADQPQRNNLKYPGFSMSGYTQAVDRYLARTRKLISRSRAKRGKPL